MATSGSAAVDTDPTGLGPEVKRYRGKGAAGGDFCFWVVPGVLIPMGLRYGLRVDPATAAGVFDTMLTDILGFFIFLGLATVMLDQVS